MPSNKRFVLVDSNALVHRAYHAYPANLHTRAGQQVNAVFGFSVMLLKIINDLSPDCIVCVFDSEKPTFRHKKYQLYKAQRKPLDEGLIKQFPLVKDVVDAFDIPRFEMEEFEADDLIGSITRSKEVEKYDVIIVTGDHDILQLVNERVSVFMAGFNFNNSKIYTPKEVLDRYGF